MSLSQLLILLSFGLNIFLCARALLRHQEAISLYKIVWLFGLYFLSLMPLFQYLMGQFPWQRKPSNDTLLKANTLLALFLLSFDLIYRHWSSKRALKTATSSPDWSYNKNKVIPLFVIACSISIAFTQGGKFWLHNNGLDINNHSLQLFADKGLKGICLMGLLMLMQLRKEQSISKLVFYSLLLLGFVAQFPIALPRYWLFTFYLPIGIWFGGAWLMRHKKGFDLLLSAALLLVFPIMSLFRFGPTALLQAVWKFKTIFSFSFLGGDFDAYSAMCSSIDYVQEQGLSYGKQLATVFLFFIPRSIWPSKGIGSGAMINSLPGSDFRNFSCPFPAEGYINFGLFGLLLFAAVLAWACGRYDRFYQAKKEETSWGILMYPSAMAMLFFILRGDLLSSFAYTVGIFTAAYCAHLLLRTKKS